jgi:hypothetical protein
MTTFQAYSLDFLPEDLNEHELTGDSIRVHRFVLEGWLHRQESTDTKPLLAHLTNSIGITRVCCVGGPHFQDREHIYIPHWIMEQIGIENGSAVTIELLVEEIPNASMIYLKPLDTAIYHADIRECFEKKLDMFHVLQSGTMLSLEIDVLGGYKVEAYVDRVEPACICRLGGEVGVEFLEPDEGIPEFKPVPAPVPVPLQEPAEQSSTNTIVDDRPDYKKIQEEVRSSWLRKFKK